jgi:hypothetical protein
MLNCQFAIADGLTNAIGLERPGKDQRPLRGSGTAFQKSFLKLSDTRTIRKVSRNVFVFSILLLTVERVSLHALPGDSSDLQRDINQFSRAGCFRGSIGKRVKRDDRR